MRLIAIVRSHSSRVVSSNGTIGKIPALRTSTDTDPSSASTRSNAASMAASSLTSQAIPRIPGCAGASRSSAATFAPLPCRTSAMRWPMPRPAPVTTATRPDSPSTWIIAALLV